VFHFSGRLFLAMGGRPLFPVKRTVKNFFLFSSPTFASLSVFVLLEEIAFVWQSLTCRDPLALWVPTHASAFFSLDPKFHTLFPPPARTSIGQVARFCRIRSSGRSFL